MTDEVKTSGAARARALLDQIGAPESDYRLNWVSYSHDPRLVRREDLVVLRPPVVLRLPGESHE